MRHAGHKARCVATKSAPSNSTAAASVAGAFEGQTEIERTKVFAGFKITATPTSEEKAKANTKTKLKLTVFRSGTKLGTLDLRPIDWNESKTLTFSLDTEISVPVRRCRDLTFYLENAGPNDGLAGQIVIHGYVANGEKKLLVDHPVSMGEGYAKPGFQNLPLISGLQCE